MNQVCYRDVTTRIRIDKLFSKYVRSDASEHSMKICVMLVHVLWGKVMRQENNVMLTAEQR